MQVVINVGPAVFTVPEDCVEEALCGQEGVGEEALEARHQGVGRGDHVRGEVTVQADPIGAAVNLGVGKGVRSLMKSMDLVDGSTRRKK